MNIFKNFKGIVLYEPRIPQNTGCIARTSVAFKLPLHLIEPLGFSLDDKYLRRAGLDYWPYVDLHVHKDFNSFVSEYKNKSRLIGVSKSYDVELNEFSFQESDYMIFGREDNGLPDYIRTKCDQIIGICMPGISNKTNNYNGVRSLNISVATGIVCNSVLNKLNQKGNSII